jgi:hypothetical protein
MGTPSWVASTLTNTAHAPHDDTTEIGTCGNSGSFKMMRSAAF